jgi:general secretion pathway protein E
MTVTAPSKSASPVLTKSAALAPPSTKLVVPEPVLGQAGHRLNPAIILLALVQDGKIDQDEHDRVAENVKLSSQAGHALVEIARRRPHTRDGKVLGLDELFSWLAGHTKLPLMHIDPLKVNVGKIGELMSASYAQRFRILPLEVRKDEVVIACAEPFDDAWVSELTPMLRKTIVRVLAKPDDIERYTAEFFSLARSVKGAQKANPTSGGVSQSNFEQLVELGKSGKSFDANDQHIVTIVDWLLQYAFEQRASDIHFEPRRDAGAVRFRIDGVLHSAYQAPSTVMAAMTNRIKLLGRMDLVEKRRPQDGRIKTRTSNGQEIELRLSTLPTAFGEKLVMRIFDPEVLVKDFAELGFSEDELTVWQQLTSKPNGIVLVTGPTGSGKTTTLYTSLKTLATEEVNVCTIEDPIEMVEPSFNQMQVNPAVELNFAEGLRSLMRQDPDIIMIGEIRDLETAEMAVQAALTGHLVLSTLHTNDAPSAITRMLDLGVPSYLIASTLMGVMAQRLVRTLCVHCKIDDGVLADDDWNRLITPFRAAKPTRIYRPVGCIECRMTGFKGRTGLYELMQLDDSLRSTINANPSLDVLREAGLRAGLQPLRLAGARKIAAGLTTMEEVRKVAVF